MKALAIDMMQCAVIILVKLRMTGPVEICRTKDANCLAEIFKKDPIVFCSSVSKTFLIRRGAMLKRPSLEFYSMSDPTNPAIVLSPDGTYHHLGRSLH